MKYYRVKKKGDGVRVYTRKNNYSVQTCELIENELYTLREFQKLFENAFFDGRKKKEDIFEIVEVSRKQVYRLLEHVSHNRIMQSDAGKLSRGNAAAGGHKPAANKKQEG